MRFIYADPALCLDVGHHASTCRAVMAELAARRIPARALAFTTELDARLQAEFGVLPFFRYNSYWASDGDPIAGAETAFHEGAQVTREDLRRLADLNASDIVFFPWAAPAQFYGALLWLRDLPPEKMPLVVVNFLHVPDMAFGLEGELVPPDYRIEPKAVFMRFAAKAMTEPFASRLVASYLNPQGVELLRALMGIAVEQLPQPQAATTACRRRTSKGPLTIGMLGHQRGYAKGLYFMGEMVPALLAMGDVRVVIHNGARERDSDVDGALKEMAAADKRLTLVDGHLPAAEWARLLDSIDLALCPYSREEYRLAGSGVHNECIANAIPCIVPSDTALSTMAAEYGAASVTFGPGEPASILSATRDMLVHFDRYADAAQAGAAKWARENGPKHLVDRLIALASAPRGRTA